MNRLATAARSTAVSALVWSLDWAPAEAGGRHARRFPHWCRTQSRVLPLACSGGHLMSRCFRLRRRLGSPPTLGTCCG